MGALYHLQGIMQCRKVLRLPNLHPVTVEDVRYMLEQHEDAALYYISLN